jgi:FkbM family methyltransferase
MLASHRSADLLARVLNTVGYFPGKTRLANSLGVLSHALRAARGVIPLTDGKTMTVDLTDRIQRLMWGGIYEPHVKFCLSALLRSGDVFIDVGAHIGFFSLIASSLVGPAGTVFAFEPNSDLFPKLRANAGEFPWLIPYPRAVSKESGPTVFSRPRPGEETGWGKLAAVRCEGQISPIEAASLDHWHASVGFPLIRAIKIDAEGSEPFVLQGARSLIVHSRPALIIEVNDPVLRSAGQCANHLIAAILKSGYRIFAMHSVHLDELDPANNPCAPEILCIAAEQFENIKKLLKNFQISARH